MRLVVITGVGVISSIGLRLDDIAPALQEGWSGINVGPERKERGYRSSLNCLIKDFDAAARFDRQTRRTIGEAAAEGRVHRQERPLETPDRVSAALHLPVRSWRARPRTILKNSLGFGGTNASLVLRALEG